ncbi:MAG: carbonic anhydrase [Anaerolineae bacterium]|nr:carbonic anhydrase [Anaerolineae bacterium]
MGNNRQLDSQQALDRLLVGNRRYTSMRQLHPRQTIVQRQNLIEGQYPFAAILSCSDSRVPSELIFDQGLGDLFIVRTAGHAINEVVIASLEYAVFVLRVPLIMVLGHGQCGAVTAVMTAQDLPGHLPQLTASLRPAMAGVNPAVEGAIDRAIRASSRFTATYLATHSSVLKASLDENNLRIVAGYYNMSSGGVDILE